MLSGNIMYGIICRFKTLVLSVGLSAAGCTQFALSARTISGTVCSDSDSTAIVGASCRLFAGERFLAGTASGDNGVFEVATDDNSGVRLEVSMTGFNTTEIVIPGSGDAALGTVYLSEGVTLGEVTATASGVSEVRGRTILFPSASDVKASSTAVSLFQKLPLAGLEANPISRTVTVDGRTPVILINGVPSTIDDFNSLQPKDIAKIEYSRITPARYADRGNSGFINITLKERSDGGQIYAWGRSAVSTAFVDANIKASYHQGASQFSLLYSPSWRNYQQVYDDTDESFIGDDFRVDLQTHDRNPFNYSYHNVRLKYDWTPTANTLFSATFRVMPSVNKSRFISSTHDSSLGDYNNLNHVKSNDFSPSLDLFFRHDFNSRNSIEAQIVGTLSSSDYRRTNSYVYDDGDVTDYVMDVDSRRRSLISEVCYNHSFSDNTSLSAGLQNTLSRSTNRYLLSDNKPVLTENNNYAYARLGQQVGDVYLSLATGMKMFWTKNDLNRRHFIKNLSTAQVSWTIDRHWSVNGAFSYSPSIPSLSALTDCPQQQTPYLVSNGNPDLKVSDIYYGQISGSYRTGKFSATYIAAVMDMRGNEINDVAYLGDHLFLRQTVNGKWLRYMNNAVKLKISEIAGFGASASFSVEYYQSAAESWKHHLTTFDANFTMWWNHGPFTVSYWRRVPGKYLNGNYVGKYENGDALSVEFKPGSHWTLGVDWMYMFERRGSQYPSWSYSPVNPSSSDRYIRNNGNMVVLSASYSADFGTLFRSSRRSLNNSDNASSLLKL